MSRKWEKRIGALLIILPFFNALDINMLWALVVGFGLAMIFVKEEADKI